LTRARRGAHCVKGVDRGCVWDPRVRQERRPTAEDAVEDAVRGGGRGGNGGGGGQLSKAQLADVSGSGSGGR